MFILDSYNCFFTAFLQKALLQQKSHFLADYFSYFNRLFSHFNKIKVRYYRASAHSQIFLLQRNAFLCKIPIVSQTIKRWLRLQIFCVICEKVSAKEGVSG
jgi:hypothetical protein